MARRKHPQRKPRTAPRLAPAAALAPNYQYWREHGGEWPEEYEQRKKRNVAYHIQEIMLADYFAHSAPARVLEYGCGPGRHLRYLNDLPGIEVHGFDQSAAMAEGIRRWASQEWFAERVVVGEPTGRLPYADGSFDVVFTAEVLVHVRPEDLEGVLEELVRVASWQVLHLETSHDWELHQVAHEGCWKHDLRAAYARLGLECELLPRGYGMHTPHRVVLSRRKRLYTWPTGAIALLSRMEGEIGRGWKETAEQCDRERKRAEGAEARQQSLGDRVSELIRQLDETKQRARQAEVRSESHLERLQMAQESLEKQGAAARERAAAEAAARQKQEDRAREAEARCEQYAGRIQSLNEALEKQILASQERAAKDAEAKRRLEDRASALERQTAVSQERNARETEARQRLEVRIAQGVEERKRLEERIVGEAAARQKLEERASALRLEQQGAVQAAAAERKRLEERIAAEAAARQKLEERASALRLEQQVAVQKAAGAEQRLSTLQEQLGQERTRVRDAELRSETYLKRVEDAKQTLEKQIAASQQRAARDAETRQRLEERVAQMAEARRTLEERIAALQREREAEAQRAAEAVELLATLRAQIEQEKKRSRDAESRCELYLGRVQETKEALEKQVAAGKESAAQGAELRKRLEERLAALGQKHSDALRRAESVEQRLLGLQDRFEQERVRSRDAESRCELYLARFGEAKQALERQTASAKELSAQLAQRTVEHQRRITELERDHEAAISEETKRSAERQLQLEEAVRAATRSAAELNARAQELEGLLGGTRAELQRLVRERAAQQREDEAKRRRLAEQVRGLEARHQRFVASLREQVLGTGAAATSADPEQEARVLLERAGEARFELGFIKQRTSYRLLRRLRRTLPYGLARWLPRRNRDVVSVRALGTKNPAASDCEVWLLGARSDPGAPAVPWDFVAQRGTWHRRPDPSGPYGEVLVSKRGRLRFALHGEAPALTFLKHPWSGQVEVRFAGRREVFDLYSPQTEGLEVRPAQQPMGLPGGSGSSEPVPQAPAAAPAARSSGSGGASSPSREPFSAEDARWLESMQRANAQVLALHVPRWLGVTSSTRILFPHLLAFPRSAAQEPYHLSAEEIRYNAELVLASGVRHVVASGGDEIHFKVIREVKRRDPSVRCDVLWHASYVQMTEDYNWALLRMWIEGARAGIVDTVGTVKQGMEQFLERSGIRSRFVMNYVPEVPSGPSTPREGGPHLGVWISGNSYRKLPYAMLAAVKMIPGAVLHGSNFVKRVRDAIDLFQIPVHRTFDKALPQEEMLAAIRETHLTLYVTFSECSPMLPLESLSVGTPCLVGPTSHLFEDDEFLRSRLVVPAPDRADVIAQWIEGALAERDAIVRAYMRWAPAYNEQARKSLEEFLRG